MANRTLLGFLATLPLVAPAAAAQTLDVGSGSSIRIETLRVAATVEQGVARVEVDETFRNSTLRELEGVYRFRLPADAVIGAFSMWMNGVEKRGRVLEATQARATYDSIVRKRRDPGLLEQVGWRDFRVSVYPIPARETVRVKLVYAHLLRDDLGLQTLEIPLPEGCGAIGDLGVRVDFFDASALTGLDCPSHRDAVLSLGPQAAVATLDGDGVAPEGPFVVRAVPRRTGFGATLLSARPQGSDSGWFVAQVVPRLAEPPRIGRDLVFVIDRSGSMRGRKMEQARAALLAGLETLRPGDRFEVISFSSDVTALAESGLLDASAANLGRARAAAADLAASGGTNLAGALAAAAKRLARDERRFAGVVFLTDGDPTVGETDPERILASWRANGGESRLFAFGVGDEVKEFLLTKLALAGRGEARYVREDEDLEIPLAALFERLRTPLLLDPVVELEGVGVEIRDREPRRLPDLFQGRPLLVAGRYVGAGKGVLRLRGRTADRELALELPIELPAATVDRPHVAQIWAKARVERLLDDLRSLGANAELRQEILTLGLEHQLVTPFTSFLVVELGVKLANGGEPGPANDGLVDEGTADQRVPGPLLGPRTGGAPSGPMTSGAGAFAGRRKSSGPDAVPTFGGAGDTTPPTGGGGAGIRPTTGALGGKGRGGEGFERWEFWWEHNQDPFLELNQRRPSLHKRLLPVFLEALKNPDADVADAAALAIGRSVRSEDAGLVLPALIEALHHPKPTVRQSATLALGVLGSPDAEAMLLDLLLDSENGRALTNHPPDVEPLVRAFAAASLGLIADPKSIDALAKVACDPSPASRFGIPSMSIHALGMMKDRHADVVTFLLGLMKDRSLHHLVRAQAPIALGRLNRSSTVGSPEARAILDTDLVPLFEDDQSDNDLRRSLAIAIGMLATVEDDAAIAALMAAVAQGNDDQTRHFSIMALAEIGALDVQPAKHAQVHAALLDFFVRELVAPKRITHQPFGALGLAVYARNPDLDATVKERAAGILLEQFRATSNPSYAGAMAIGLGLLDAKLAADDLWKRFEETNDPPLRGHVAVSLGLMRIDQRAEALRATLVKKGLDPKLRLQVARALGLMRDGASPPLLIRCLREASTLVECSAAAQALALCGHESSIEPLLALAGDEDEPTIARGFALVALGRLAEKCSLPWNAPFSIDCNYRAKSDALAEILDLQ
jgi:Ca-activated chloride channel family protein